MAKTTVSTGMPTPDLPLIPPLQPVSGTWTAGPIITVPVLKTSVEGTKVIKQAQCTFTFNGVDVVGTPVTGTETLVLNPDETVLTDNSDDLLVEGDSVEGQGFVLKVFDTDGYNDCIDDCEGDPTCEANCLAYYNNWDNWLVVSTTANRLYIDSGQNILRTAKKV